MFRQLRVTGSALPFLTFDHMTQTLRMDVQSAESLQAAINRMLRHQPNISKTDYNITNSGRV